MNEQYFTSLNGYKVKDEYAIHTYDTVANMKGDTKLKEGMHIKTKGYYSVNDGGSSEYIIKSDVTLDEYKEDLNNGLYAVLIIKNNSVNIKQLGGICEEDSNYSKRDNKIYIDKIIDIIKNGGNISEVIFDCGTYLFSETSINLESGEKSLNIKGSVPVRVFNGYQGKTFTSFAPYNNEQRYIIKLGGNPNFEDNPTGSRGLSISDIRFTSIQDNTDNITPLITKGALCIDNNSGGVYPRLDFYKINGSCLNIRASFELDFGIVNVRTKANYDYDSIIFDDITGSNSLFNNISSCNFETLRMENIAGNHIYINPKSNFDMNTINYFELECNYPNLLGAERKQDYDGTQTIDYNKAVFHGMFRRLVISHMNLSMHSNYYGRYNNENYRVNSVFCYDVPTTETNRYNRIQIGEILVRYVNNANALTNKQYIYEKKYTSGNELIQIGNIYAATDSLITNGLFKSDNCMFNRIEINSIKDDHQQTPEMKNVIKAYTVPYVLNTGTIVSFENSKFYEGLGLSGGNTVVSKIVTNKGDTHNLGMGLYCPSGNYKIIIGTSNGDVILTDAGEGTARYVDIVGEINTEIGELITIKISNDSPDVIIDYFNEY